VCRFCLQHYEKLLRWEMHLLTSLAGYKARPSDKQMDILRRLYGCCRQAGCYEQERKTHTNCLPIHANGLSIHARIACRFMWVGAPCTKKRRPDLGRMGRRFKHNRVALGGADRH
jgi:hypothetical protein